MDQPKDKAVKYVCAIRGCGRKEAERIVSVLGEAVLESKDMQDLGDAYDAKLNAPQPAKPASQKPKESTRKP